MKTVYFDTNVYSHIYKRLYGITDADVEKLIAKIRADKLRVYLSSALLEETTSAILSAEKESISRLRLIHNIAKRKRILRPYQDIIKTVITGYAKDEGSGSFFMSPHHYE